MAYCLLGSTKWIDELTPEVGTDQRAAANPGFVPMISAD